MQYLLLYLFRLKRSFLETGYDSSVRFYSSDILDDEGGLFCAYLLYLCDLDGVCLLVLNQTYDF